MKIPHIAFVCTLAITLVLPALASAQEQPLTADLRAGPCDAAGDVASLLSAPIVPQGDPIGAPGSVPAATSYSETPLPYDVLLATEHVLTISAGDDMVACGPIGGIQGANGSLALVLDEREDSGVSGVAFLAPAADPAMTAVSLFLDPGDGTTRLSAIESESAGIEQDTSDQNLESSSITAEEQAYFDQVTPLLTTMTESFDQATALTEDPHFGDPFWTIDLVTEFAVWDESYEQALALSPPPSLANLHAQVVEAFRLYSEAGTDFAQGMDALDTELINQGASKMTQASERIDQANDLLEEFKRERGQ